MNKFLLAYLVHCLAGLFVGFRDQETPGHAKGALCFYDEEAKILFAGDTVFPDLGIPRTDLPGSEPEKLKETYSRLETLDIKTIYPGHGEKIEEKDYVKKILKLLD